MYYECKTEKRARLKKNKNNAIELLNANNISFTIANGLIKTKLGYYRFSDGFYKIKKLESRGINSFITQHYKEALGGKES